MYKLYWLSKISGHFSDVQVYNVITINLSSHVQVVLLVQIFPALLRGGNFSDKQQVHSGLVGGGVRDFWVKFFLLLFWPYMVSFYV